jgi:hypothetical protein
MISKREMPVVNREIQGSFSHHSHSICWHERCCVLSCYGHWISDNRDAGGANFLSAPGPRALEGEKDPGDAALQKALEIARTELSRRRRGLGNLTQEQETVIEDLLKSTVKRVSELAGRILESLPAVP